MRQLLLLHLVLLSNLDEGLAASWQQLGLVLSLDLLCELLACCQGIREGWEVAHHQGHLTLDIDMVTDEWMLMEIRPGQSLLCVLLQGSLKPSS